MNREEEKLRQLVDDLVSEEKLDQPSIEKIRRRTKEKREEFKTGLGGKV